MKKKFKNKMKYFTKILSVFLCAAEISVLAQLPNAPFASQDCKKAITSFNEGSLGKTLEKCSGLIENGAEFCNQCSNIELPGDLKNGCKTGEDKVYLETIKSIIQSYNSKMTEGCKKTSKTASSSTSKLPKTTTIPTNSTTTTTVTRTHTHTQITISASSTKKSTKSATKTIQPTQPAPGQQQPAPAQQQPAQQQPAQGLQQPAQGLQQQPAQGVNPTDPQLSQVPITDPISNTNTNQPVDATPEELDSSATKVGFTLVAVVLAAFNLLL